MPDPKLRWWLSARPTSKRVRVGKPARIPVGGPEHEDQGLTGGKGYVVDLDWYEGVASEALHRGIVAEHLAHSRSSGHSGSNTCGDVVGQHPQFILRMVRGPVAADRPSS